MHFIPFRAKRRSRRSLLSRMRQLKERVEGRLAHANQCHAMSLALAREQLWLTLCATPRFQEPGRLLRHGAKSWSQGREDGMLTELFRRIGTTTRRFVEIGVEDGRECNTLLRLLEGWRGAWVDADPTLVDAARRRMTGWPLHVEACRVTSADADALVQRLAEGEELDLLSIDIDFHDYWVWQAITSVRPRAVVIEYNATLPPHVRTVVRRDEPDGGWDGHSNYFGASLGALAALGEEKGYALVGCSPEGVNAFFVRADLVGDHFHAPFTAEVHYEPARYTLAGPAGHAPGFGPWQAVSKGTATPGPEAGEDGIR